MLVSVLTIRAISQSTKGQLVIGITIRINSREASESRMDSRHLVRMQPTTLLRRVFLLTLHKFATGVESQDIMLTIVLRSRTSRLLRSPTLVGRSCSITMAR
jgi:hypothetical protein